MQAKDRRTWGEEGKRGSQIEMESRRKKGRGERERHN